LIVPSECLEYDTLEETKNDMLGMIIINELMLKFIATETQIFRLSNQDESP